MRGRERGEMEDRERRGRQVVKEGKEERKIEGKENR